MAELTNLTDRLAHLRDRKGNSSAIHRTPTPSGKPSRKPNSGRERKFATDIFMLFVYGLLGVALVSQIILIVWLDVV